MHTYKLNLFPKSAAVCNNCKWFVATDKADITSGIPSDKFGIGRCECGKNYRLFGGWSPPASLKRLDETCQRFSPDIHQKFGLTADETEDYFNYINFFNNCKIILIRERREERQVEMAWNKIKSINNGTA